MALLSVTLLTMLDRFRRTASITSRSTPRSDGSLLQGTVDVCDACVQKERNGGNAFAAQADDVGKYF